MQFNDAGKLNKKASLSVGMSLHSLFVIVERRMSKTTYAVMNDCTLIAPCQITGTLSA